MGVGVAAMHFTGMRAMEMSPGIDYTVWKVALSVAVAIFASMAALWLAFTLRASNVENRVVKRLGAAIIMAVAITGMHYLGMDAANFAPGSLCLADAKLDANWLALVVTAMSFTVLVGTLALFALHTSSLSISLKRANRQLRYLGTHDALTRLPNRQQLTLRIAQAIEDGARRASPFAVLFIDLDGFKSINDSLGHGVGDDLLQVCAERLREDLRHTDMVARLGGDEFVIVVGNAADTSAAMTVANGVLGRLAGDRRQRLAAAREREHRHCVSSARRRERRRTAPQRRRRHVRREAERAQYGPCVRAADESHGAQVADPST